jgi:hypothetical protein
MKSKKSLIKSNLEKNAKQLLALRAVATNRKKSDLQAEGGFNRSTWSRLWQGNALSLPRVEDIATVCGVPVGEAWRLLAPPDSKFVWRPPEK